MNQIKINVHHISFFKGYFKMVIGKVLIDGDILYTPLPILNCASSYLIIFYRIMLNSNKKQLNYLYRNIKQFKKGLN